MRKPISKNKDSRESNIFLYLVFSVELQISRGVARQLKDVFFFPSFVAMKRRLLLVSRMLTEIGGSVKFPLCVCL